MADEVPDTVGAGQEMAVKGQFSATVSRGVL
jgi:hypothetical protein